MGNRVAVIGAEQQERPDASIDVSYLQEIYDTPLHTEPVAERYAHSTRLIRTVGRLVTQNTVIAPEHAPMVERLHAEYESAILEMLNTDPEFRDQLEINSEDTYQTVNSKIVTADGVTELEGLIENGARASREKAEDDPRMEIQALRDQTDLEGIRAIQALKPGQGRIALSMDPKEAFAKGKDFWEGLGMLGYREGLAFLQWAYKVDDNTIILGTYSVDKSNLSIWRDVLTEHGLVIPENETTSTWHGHALTIEGALEDVRDKVIALRTDFYNAEGSLTKRYSVNDYMQLNQPVIDNAFELLYLPLTRSEASGRKHPVIHSFVRGLLQKPDLLNPQTLAELRHIYRTDTFDGAATRIIDHCIRYGVVERLRTGLKFLVKGHKAVVQGFAKPGVRQGVSIAEQAAQSLAGNVLTGVRENRQYGGCSVEVKMAADRDASKREKDTSATTDVARENAAEGDGEEGGVPDEIRCPECSMTSDADDIIHVDEEGNGFWECPCCGYWADVCTGESGFRNGDNHKGEKARETVIAEVFEALGFTTTALATDRDLA